MNNFYNCENHCTNFNKRICHTFKEAILAQNKYLSLLLTRSTFIYYQRAALLRGGIVGHLAREHLAIESACLGPLSTVTVHYIGFNIIDGIGKKYWDDELANDEIDVICGLHCCYTGM